MWRPYCGDGKFQAKEFWFYSKEIERGNALKVFEQGNGVTRTEHFPALLCQMIWREETVVTETGEVAVKLVKSRVHEGLA